MQRKNLRRPGTTKAAKASAKAVTASAIAKATKAAHKPAVGTSPSTKRPGVIAFVIALINRPNGCTVGEAKPLLAKAFPERSADSMAHTFSLNMHLFAVRREKVEGREGTVFYGKGGK